MITSGTSEEDSENGFDDDQTKISTQRETLTDFEAVAQRTWSNLADGHAYHELEHGLSDLPSRLPELWHNSRRMLVPEAEQQFLDAFAELANSSAFHAAPLRKVAPTASNSIDIVGAFLSELGMVTALIEPTFDNLALILKRRKVPLLPISELNVTKIANKEPIPKDSPILQCQAMFFVDPNNPTGWCLTETQLTNVAEFCREYKILLVIDKCFRFFRTSPFDDYSVLEKSGCEYIVFEDTGKVWPTQDLKASIIVASKGPAALLEKIYNEIYLCHSPFALMMLAECYRKTSSDGLLDVVWSIVERRRGRLRDVISGTKVSIVPMATMSTLPLEWLDVSAQSASDLEFTRLLETYGVSVLPGRQFFWASNHDPKTHGFARVAMMKPRDSFNMALAKLGEFLVNNNVGAK